MFLVAETKVVTHLLVAALQAPMIITTSEDRKRSEGDYMMDLKVEWEVGDYPEARFAIRRTDKNFV